MTCIDTLHAEGITQHAAQGIGFGGIQQHVASDDRHDLTPLWVRDVELPLRQSTATVRSLTPLRRPCADGLMAGEATKHDQGCMPLRRCPLRNLRSAHLGARLQLHDLPALWCALVL